MLPAVSDGRRDLHLVTNVRGDVALSGPLLNQLELTLNGICRTWMICGSREMLEPPARRPAIAIMSRRRAVMAHRLATGPGAGGSGRMPLVTAVSSNRGARRRRRGRRQFLGLSQRR
jgi:hypothetical protein